MSQNSKMNLDPETEVPAEFWSFIDEHGQDADAFCDALAELDRGKLELYFLVYVQLRADLADCIITSQQDCSEDTADDVADGIIIQGRELFLKVYNDGKIPPRDEWPAIEELATLHEFDAAYDERFDDDIWELTDALEEDKLPWEATDES